MQPVADIHTYLRLLEEGNELCRIDTEVDPNLELAAIVDKVCKSEGGGRALCFERVKGCQFPVVANLFGSPTRIARALGASTLEEAAGRFASFLASRTGAAAVRLQELTAQFAPLVHPPGSSPSREVLVDPVLSLLPHLRVWPGDGGSYLSLPMVFTRHPETGERNCGIYRMQLFNSHCAGLHLRPESDADCHLAAWRDRKEAMPVAVALGGAPALYPAAAANLPAGIDEVCFAGLLQGAPVAMTPAEMAELSVPAGAEFVLEGTVDPREARLEGPFGNHTGAYHPPAAVHIFRPLRISHRRSPIFPGTIVGPPPTENSRLASSISRLLLPLLKIDFPEVVDCHLPEETIFHGCALVSARSEGGGGRELLRRLRHSNFFARSRLLVLFSEEIDVQDPSHAWWRAVNRVDPGRDLVIEAGWLGIDASRMQTGEPLIADATTLAIVERRWREYGIE